MTARVVRRGRRLGIGAVLPGGDPRPGAAIALVVHVVFPDVQAAAAAGVQRWQEAAVLVRGHGITAGA